MTRGGKVVGAVATVGLVGLGANIYFRSDSSTAGLVVIFIPIYVLLAWALIWFFDGIIRRELERRQR